MRPTPMQKHVYYMRLIIITTKTKDRSTNSNINTRISIIANEINCNIICDTSASTNVNNLHSYASSHISMNAILIARNDSTNVKIILM